MVLGTFTGEDRLSRAREAMDKLGDQTTLRGLRLAERGKAVIIEYGQYVDPASAEARSELERVRAMLIDGSPALAPAFFAPPEGEAGGVAALDLRGWAREPDAQGALYTLQVAAYGRDDAKAPSPKERQEYRAAAEKAAAQLRREGERAFYYHGPFLSLVTIGLFTAEDVDSQRVKVESPRLAALREKFPSNLLNGKGIRETFRTADGATRTQLQPSVLVRLPE